jgi:hypothetical protein
MKRKYSYNVESDADIFQDIANEEGIATLGKFTTQQRAIKKRKEVIKMIKSNDFSNPEKYVWVENW